MAKAATVQARIEPKLKAKTDAILSKLGITASQAINAFYAQIVLNKGLPFQLKMPSKKTTEAIQELEQGSGQVYSTFQEIVDDLDSKDA